MTAPVLHFFPGGRAPVFLPRSILGPSARVPCGTPAVPLFATSSPADVSCARCRASAVFADEAARAAAGVSTAWTAPAYVAAGLLAANAPPPPERPAPYRNPRILTYDRDAPGGPLDALARWVRERAGRLLESQDPASRLAARELVNVAAQLEHVADVAAGRGGVA